MTSDDFSNNNTLIASYYANVAGQQGQPPPQQDTREQRPKNLAAPRSQRTLPAQVTSTFSSAAPSAASIEFATSSTLANVSTATPNATSVVQSSANGSRAESLPTTTNTFGPVAHTVTVSATSTPLSSVLEEPHATSDIGLVQHTESSSQGTLPELTEKPSAPFNAFAGLSSQTQAILDKLKNTPPTTTNGALSLQKGLYPSSGYNRSIASSTDSTAKRSSGLNHALQHHMKVDDLARYERQDHRDRYRPSSQSNVPVSFAAATSSSFQTDSVAGSVVGLPGMNNTLSRTSSPRMPACQGYQNSAHASQDVVSRDRPNSPWNSIRDQDHDTEYAHRNPAISASEDKLYPAKDDRNRYSQITSLVAHKNAKVDGGAIYEQGSGQSQYSGEVQKQLPQQPGTQTDLASQVQPVHMHMGPQKQHQINDQRKLDRDRLDSNWGDLSPIQDMSPAYEDATSSAHGNGYAAVAVGGSGQFGMRSSLPRAQSGTISDMLTEFDRGVASGLTTDIYGNHIDQSSSQPKLPFSTTATTVHVVQQNTVVVGSEQQHQLQHQLQQQQQLQGSTVALSKTSPTRRTHRRLPQQPPESQAVAAKLPSSVSNCSMQSLVVLSDGKSVVSSAPRMLGTPSNIALTSSTVGTAATSAVAKYTAPAASLVCGVQRCSATPVQILQSHQCTGLVQIPQVQVTSEPTLGHHQVAQLHSCPQHGYQTASPIVPALTSVQTVATPCCHHHTVAATPVAQVVQLVQPHSGAHPTNPAAATATASGSQEQHQHQPASHHQPAIQQGQATTTPIAMATPQSQQHACQTTAISSSSKTPITPQTPGSTQVIVPALYLYISSPHPSPGNNKRINNSSTTWPPLERTYLVRFISTAG